MKRIMTIRAVVAISVYTEDDDMMEKRAATAAIEHLLPHPDDAITIAPNTRMAVLATDIEVTNQFWEDKQ